MLDLLADVVADDEVALLPIVTTVPAVRPPRGGGGVVLPHQRQTKEPDLTGVFEAFESFFEPGPDERPRCDGKRGNHGDPAIVCAMCCDTPEDPEDWGSSTVMTG